MALIEGTTKPSFLSPSPRPSPGPSKPGPSKPGPSKPSPTPRKMPYPTGGAGKGLAAPAPMKSPITSSSGLGVAGAGGANRAIGGVGPLRPILPGRLTADAQRGAGLVQPPPPPAPLPIGEQIKQALLAWMQGTNTRGPNSGSTDLVPGDGWDKFKELGGY